MTTQKLKLTQIRLDGNTQPRTAIDAGLVSEYAEAIMASAAFPPVVVFHDGTDYWLGDGFHRVHATRQVGCIDIDAEVRTGTVRDALLYAVGANADHGLRRTNADKRRAVEILLRDEVWSQWSDKEIARRCAVGYTLVAKVREEVSTPAAGVEKLDERKFVSRHGTEGTRKVPAKKPQPLAKSAKAAAPTAPPPPDAPGDDDRQSPAELLEDMQRDIERLTRENKVLTADDTKAELARQVQIREGVERARDDEMSKNAKLVQQRDFYMKQLRRCGKAVGQDDLDKVSAAVEAFVRLHKPADKRVAA